MSSPFSQSVSLSPDARPAVTHPPGAAPPIPVTAYDTAIDGIAPDGATTIATALDAFSAAITPLPGATTGRQREPVRSATLAVRMFLRHWAS